MSKSALQQSQNFRANVVLVALALFFVLILGAGLFLRDAPATSPSPPNEVTLQGFPGNGSVQLFDTLGDDAQVIATIPDGTVCANLGPKLDGSQSGVEMYFYQVECNGTLGFVNVRWTR